MVPLSSFSGEMCKKFSVRSGALAVLLVATCMIASAVPIFGQAQDKAGERGFNPGKSYAVSDIETIGLYSGNVMINMPLGSLPAGRGGVSGGFSLNYNSKIWDTFASEVIRFTTTHDMKVLAESDEGGWRYNYRYYLKLDYRNLGFGQGACTVGEEDTYTIVKVLLVTPDGAQHTMQPQGIGVIGTDDFANVYPDGRLQCDPVAVTPGQLITFYSKDSTFLRLEVLTDSDTTWENNTWTLYMPDGSKVGYNPNSSTRQTITDRNGNYVQIVENATDSSYSNHRTTYLKDQFDRKVVIEYDAATNEDRIYSKGFNGETLTTRVTWKTIIVNKTYWACEMAPAPLDPNAHQNYVLNEAFRVVDKIHLPTQVSGNLFYEFDYNADTTTSADVGWGEIDQVTTPSGATAAYEYYYDDVTGGSSIDAESVLLNRPVEKNLTYNREYDGSTTSQTDTWLYTPTATYNVLQNLTSVTVISPDGSATTEHYTQQYDRLGEVYKTVGPDGSLSEKIYDTNAPISGFAGNGKTNRYVKYEFTSITDSGGTPVKTAIKEYSQDKNGNTTEVREYDFVSYSSVPRTNGLPTGLPSGITPVRITKTEFYNPTPDAASTTYTDADSYHLSSSERLLRLAKSTEVQDGSATPKSRSEITYDYTNYDSSNTKGGNVTETKTWDSYKGGQVRAYSNPLTAANSISTSATYNQYGMPLAMTDANGVVTQITYGSITTPTGAVFDLYPTQTVSAYGTSIARTSTAVYDFHTGLVTTATDADNNVSVVTEYDALGRPTKVRTAANTPLESWTRTEYNDVARRVVVRSDIEAVGDGRKVAVQHYDQLGRVRLSRTLENASTEDPYNEQHGIKVQTRYATGNPNSYQLTSNPYRAATSAAASTEPTMGWTRSKSWNHGRRSETETFSGASLPAPWGTNATSTGVSVEEEDANSETSTDEAGKKRRTVTDALGRMVRVDEPDANGNLGTLASPVQPTNYVYDTLGNLTQIVQGGQTRSFTYCSLSRLLSATNPESGTFQYGYDNVGNLLTKTDARGISTVHTYDALNRVTFRNYSDSTPDITYTYDDPLVTFSKGKLTKVASAVSEAWYLGYDAQDRITGSRQRTDGVDYNFAYTYNLDDDLKTQTYPSGKVVAFAYDSSGDLASVSGTTGTTTRLYANSFGYAAHGVVEQVRLGNSRWESTRFNSDRQIVQIGLGHSTVNTGLWKVNYDYGDWEGTTLNAQKNNGNLARQTITVPTVGPATGFTAIQSYTYDPLDRLKSATETIGGNQTWKQTFLYDRFGNKSFDVPNTTTLASCPAAVCNPTASLINNRLAGYGYDNSGNVLTDAEGRTFTYDAENRQTTATGSNLSMSYSYNGNGKRIKSHNSLTNQTTIFVYDAEGDLSAEYTINIPLPTNPTISYLTEDALGSPRAITNAFGEIKARRDFLPFGEELYAGLGGRNTNQKYSSNADDTRKKFATYQRDIETGLDFAQSRYYSPVLGRFTSPDEFKGGPDELFDFEANAADNPTFYADLTNPQSLNKYQYTYNNPYKYNDPSGHCPVCVIVVVVAVAIATGPDYAVAPTGRESDAEMASYRSTGGNAALANLIPMPGLRFLPRAFRSSATRNATTQGRNATTRRAASTTRGRNSEKRVLKDKGLEKNTKKVSSKEGNSVPDAQTKTEVIEIKDTKTVSDTKQLRIQRDAASETNRKHVVVTGQNTKVSKTVKKSSTEIERRSDLGPQN